MKLIAKVIGGVFGLAVAIFVAQGVASESGEVVMLTTVDQATGDNATTRQRDNAVVGGGLRWRDVVTRRCPIRLDPARARANYAGVARA